MQSLSKRKLEAFYESGRDVDREIQSRLYRTCTDERPCLMCRKAGSRHRPRVTPLLPAMQCGLTPRERNDALYRRLRSGDATARDRLIEANLPLVMSCVQKFIATNSDYMYLHDDLFGAGQLSLVKAVDALAKVVVDSPSDYLELAIANDILDAAVESAVIGPTRSAIGRAKKRDCEIEKTEVVFDADIGLVYREDKSFGVIDVADEIEACCQTETDEAIVELRREGYTDTEIEQQLGVDHVTVFRARKRIEQRYDALCEGLKA